MGEAEWGRPNLRTVEERNELGERMVELEGRVRGGSGCRGSESVGCRKAEWE
jgi:hypothetical protein